MLASSNAWTNVCFGLSGLALCCTLACSIEHDPSAGLLGLGIDDGAAEGEALERPFDGRAELSLSLQTGASLALSAGAVNRPTRLGLERPEDAQALAYLARLGNDAAVASAPYRVTPLGERLLAEASLRLPVSPKHRGGRLGVMALDAEDSDEWRLVGPAQAEGDVAEVQIGRLAIFVLVDLDAVAPGGAEPGAQDARTPAADAGADADAAVDAAWQQDAAQREDVDACMSGSWSCEDPPTTISGTLVSFLASDESGFIAQPHRIELLNAATGAPLDPARSTTSSSTGKFRFDGVPADLDVSIHVRGVGPASDARSTYDFVHIYSRRAGDRLLRIGTVGTASVYGTTGGFAPRQDRAQLSGAVYSVDDSGRRLAPVGCVQLFLDDEPHPALAADQRYVLGVLPTTLDRLDRTQRSGKFYFGNLSTGPHVLKVSIDGGRTFVAEKRFLIARTRDDAASEYKDVFTTIGIDVPGADPTPASCPSE